MIPIMCGTGKADITPGKNLLPMPLLGPLKFTHINDHIFVRSLAFQSGNEKCLIISLELTLVPYAKELIAEISEKFILQGKIFCSAPPIRMKLHLCACLRCSRILRKKRGNAIIGLAI